MNKDPVINFPRKYRTENDYFYLLVDGQAECALDHPLSVPSLIRSFGEAAVTRVLRPDLSHEHDQCPALIQLAKPGEDVPKEYLDLSADYAAWDLRYDERYICGWLTSQEPLEVVAAHIAARCYTTADEAGDPSPWFEPLRLELLLCAMQQEAGCLLRPIQHWLLPVSWGGYTMARSPDYVCDPDLSELARQTQQLAPEVNAFLGVWRHALTFQDGFAPWRWQGPGILPGTAAVHGFRLIRDARRLGLHNSSDRLSLSLHRVFMHPHLPQHPDIQQAITQARAGSLDLHSHFATYSDATWKRIVYALPLAKDYS
ncbi:hypothetical protein PSEMO_10310 [Pseudomonas putida]|uniref:Uncharacterized protein n=2 Tax=Pseudomonas putida TaxID=303 RepID=A0A1Q9R954_PSEPU|nr:hypothetical protein PSEMO_10310 [Pseudomonas putida]